MLHTEAEGDLVCPDETLSDVPTWRYLTAFDENELKIMSWLLFGAMPT